MERWSNSKILERKKDWWAWGELALPNARIDSAVEQGRVKYALINGENLVYYREDFSDHVDYSVSGVLE